MRSKAISYLELIKVPNLFTSMADPMAGLIVASASGIDLVRLPYLLASSALIFSGGSALGGYAGREENTPMRQERPTPSGRVSPAGALSFGAVLIIMGIACATGAGLFPLLASLALSAAVIMHNACFRKSALARAATMGLCSALNLVLGMSAGSFTDATILVLPFIILWFVFSISLLRSSGAAPPGLKVFSGWIAACAAVLILLFSGSFLGEGILFAAMFFAVSGIAVMAARSDRAGTEPAVQSLILAIPLLDASFASGISGIMAGMPVAAMALPAVALSTRH